MLKVTKFGGSSLADARQYEKVRNIVLSDPARRVVVVSAPGKRFKDDHKITDLLYLCHAHLKYGVPCDTVFGLIRDRYLKIRDDLNVDIDLESEFEALFNSLDKHTNEADLVSRGEYFSARLMAAYLGFEFLDAAQWLRFLPDGKVDTKTSYQLLSRYADGHSVVIPGFYGAMADGRLHLFSRGGSDITGALAAAALGADIYENWTDVSGILMADPRIVDDPRPIERITYSELRELSFIGAEVLHEDSVFPVREKDIPLNIRNTNQPDDPGTLISSRFEPEESDTFLTGIAGKKGYTIIMITKNGMSSMVGAFRQILSVFAKYNLPIAYTTSGIDCYSCILEEKLFEPYRYAILGEIQEVMQPDDLMVSDHIAMLAVVGRNMAYHSGSSGKIFQALGEKGINIRMISQGPEELNIIIGVEEKDFNDAVRYLYRKFI
ncbi:MAG: aspartate kinase [Lachnospiraceae bacterium]|nr:aspartate kinase [Lachnospiraceae bacterium]